MTSLRESERDGGVIVTPMVGDKGDNVDRSEDNETRGKELRKTVAAQQACNRCTDKQTEIRREEMGLLLPDLLTGQTRGYLSPCSIYCRRCR